MICPPTLIRNCGFWAHVKSYQVSVYKNKSWRWSAEAQADSSRLFISYVSFIEIVKRNKNSLRNIQQKDIFMYYFGFNKWVKSASSNDFETKTYILTMRFISEYVSSKAAMRYIFVLSVSQDSPQSFKSSIGLWMGIRQDPAGPWSQSPNRHLSHDNLLSVHSCWAALVQHTSKSSVNSRESVRQSKTIYPRIT